MDKELSGALFKNDKGDNPKRPDYTGVATIGGVDYQVSSWIKKSKAGTTYMSLSFQVKGEKREKPEPKREPGAGNRNDMDDEIPFRWL